MKGSHFFRHAALAVFFIFLCVSNITAQTTSGTLTTDETWSGSILITGDVTVPDAISLTIMPGTLVEFTAISDDTSGGADSSRCELIVEGILTADGESGNEIIFTSNDAEPEPNDWYGIRFVDPDDLLCSLSYCHIRWGNIGIRLDSASPSISNCVISDSSHRGISGSASDVNITLQGNEIYNSGSIADGDGITLTCHTAATAVLLDNYVHDNADRGIYCTYGGSSSNTQLTIANNTSHDNGDHGIHIYNGSSSTNLSASLQDNTVYNNGGSGVYVYYNSYSSVLNLDLSGDSYYDNAGDGIEVYYYRCYSPMNITVDGCAAFGNGEKGIRISRYNHSSYSWISDTSISGCNIYQNGDEGCYVWESASISLTENSIHENIASGITVKYSGDNGYFRANEVYLNGGHGIQSNGGSAEFSYNSIRENTGMGVDFRDGAAFFVQNDVYGNGSYGIRFHNGSGVQVVNANNIYDNDTYEIYNNTTIAVDARKNWWGTVNTAQMNSWGYTANISKLYDIHDDFTRGMIDYRGWTDAPLDTARDPASHIVFPLEGMVIPRGLIDIQGVACAAAGIDYVDVTNDGGLFWLDADGTNDWIYPWYASVTGTYNVNSKAVDEEANEETPGPGIYVDVDETLLHAWGEIFGNETWSDTVVITGDVTVPRGASLTIEPGTTVVFSKNRDDMISGTDTSRCELIIEGILVADGEPGNEIVFTSDAGAPGLRDWHGIRFVNPEHALCLMDHCDIQWTHTGITLETASPVISNCRISNFYHKGIAGSAASVDLYIQNNEISNTDVTVAAEGIALTAASSALMTLDGNHVYDNCSTGIYITHGSSSAAAQLLLANNLCHDNDNHGIHIYYADNSSNLTASLQGNTVHNNGGNGLYVYYNNYSSNLQLTSQSDVSYENSGNGLEVYYYRCYTPMVIDIDGGEFYSNGGRGIYAHRYNHTSYSWITSLTLSSCSIYENINEGCNLWEINRVELHDNDFIENESNGVNVKAGSGGAEFIGNYLYKNMGFGISCVNADARFAYNEIKKNTGHGIQFSNKTGTFIHNNIYLNQGYGVRFDGCDGVNDFHYNNIFRNDTYEMYNNSSYAVDARINWWGDVTTAQMDALGYTTNLAKVHDIHDDFALGMVDYRGWLGGGFDINVDPVSYIIDPMDGMTLPNGTYDIEGIALSSIGLDHVEASIDAGVTWEEAVGFEYWSFPWFANTEGEYTLKSKAVDVDLNEEIPGPGVTVTVDAGLKHTWGRLYTDETWNGSMYITGDVIVPSGTTLTIEPGTVVTFAANRDDTISGADTSRTELIIEGALSADGDAGNEITFTVDSAIPKKKDWYGIRFVDPDELLCVVDHCNIEWAHIGISLDSASIPITNCSLSENYYCGISGTTSDQDILIQGNLIFDNGYDSNSHGLALTCASNITAIIQGNHCSNNFADGIRCIYPGSSSYIELQIENNTCQDNGNHGLSIYSGSSCSYLIAALQNNMTYNNAADGINVYYNSYSSNLLTSLQGDSSGDNGGDGLEICYYRQYSPLNVELRNCALHGNGERGLELRRYEHSSYSWISGLVLENSDIYENAEEGCYAWSVVEVTAFGNAVYDNGAAGFTTRVGSSGFGDFTLNEVYGNVGYGIHCENGPGYFLMNQVHHNGGYGIEYNSNAAYFRYNEIHWNGGYGVRINSAGAVVDFNYNNLYLNDTYEIYNNSSYAVAAQYCWWGEAVTAEMELEGYPSNISRIYDVRDNTSLGEVVYENWESGPVPSPTMTPGPTETPGPPTLTPTITPTGPTATPTDTPEPTEIPTITPTLICINDGDVDNNGEKTPQDGQLAFLIYLSLFLDPTFEELCSADCDGDGDVTPADAQCIFWFYLELDCDCIDPIPSKGDPADDFTSKTASIYPDDIEKSIRRKESAAPVESEGSLRPDSSAPGILLAEVNEKAGENLAVISLWLKNFDTPVDSLGLRISFAENLPPSVETQFPGPVGDWLLTGARPVENELIIGAFDVLSAIPADSETLLAVIAIETHELSEGFLNDITIHSLADDIEDYEVMTFLPGDEKLSTKTTHTDRFGLLH